MQERRAGGGEAAFVERLVCDDAADGRAHRRIRKLRVERAEVLLGFGDFGRGLRAVVRVQGLRAQSDGRLGETQVVLGLLQIELRRFEVFLRDAALLVERLPSLISAARVVRGGARVAQALLRLRPLPPSARRRAFPGAARASRSAFSSCAVFCGMVPVSTPRAAARASFKAATASLRCACKSLDSSTASTSPARTTRFFQSGIRLICPLIFGETCAVSCGKIVPSAETSAAISSRSAFATFTLTTGLAASSSPDDSAARRARTISTTATIATIATADTATSTSRLRAPARASSSYLNSSRFCSSLIPLPPVWRARAGSGGERWPGRRGGAARRARSARP